jgi:chromosome partitioning protein
VIDLIHREERVFRRKIPCAAYFTRTSTAIRPKDLGHIQASLKAAGVPVLPVELTERAAYRAIMQLGGTVYDLMPSEVSNP